MIRGARPDTLRRLTRPLLGATLLLVFLAGCGRLPNAPLAARPGRGAGSASIVDGQPQGVVMMLRSGESADQVATDYGGVVVDVVPELGLYRVVMPTGEDVARLAQAMRGDARVSAVEVNGLAIIAESRQSSVAFSEGSSSWSAVHDQTALTRMGATRAQTGANGNGVLVAILDTGIAFDHPAFAGHLALPGIEDDVSISPGAERAEHVDSDHDGVLDGALGHGTHVAGIVLAVAPMARLLPVRVLDSDGIGCSFDVANGIVKAVDRGAQIINMSLGMSSVSCAVQSAIHYARDHGAVVVAPTGNDQMGRIQFPASMQEVIAVAGLDENDQHAPFTNYGPGTDLAAPSVGILSTYFGGSYARWSGTSMAAPFVSGTAALLRGLMPAGAETVSRIEEYLSGGAYSLEDIDPAYAGALGAGRVDASASLNLLRSATSSGVSEEQRWK
jgi:subtilisin family serine protease